MVRVSDFWTLLLAWLQPSQSPTKSFDNGSVSGYNAASLRFGGEMLELDDMLFINAGTPGVNHNLQQLDSPSDTSSNLCEIGCTIFSSWIKASAFSLSCFSSETFDS